MIGVTGFLTRLTRNIGRLSNGITRAKIFEDIDMGLIRTGEVADRVADIVEDVQYS